MSARTMEICAEHVRPMLGEDDLDLLAEILAGYYSAGDICRLVNEYTERARERQIEFEAETKAGI